MHRAAPGYEDEATNFMLVVNYMASALGFSLILLRGAMIRTLIMKNEIVKKE